MPKKYEQGKRRHNPVLTTNMGWRYAPVNMLTNFSIEQLIQELVRRGFQLKKPHPVQKLRKQTKLVIYEEDS